MTDDAVTRGRSGPRWWAIALAALLVAALAFAIGRFSTFGPADALPPSDTSPEAGFSRDMQAHHAQAIEMAMEIHRKTEDDELRALAYDIATGQAGQRGEMYDWLVQWGLPQSGGPMMLWMAESDAGHDHGVPDEPMSNDEANAAMGMATGAELLALREAEGTAADCLFLELMIRHHEGAIPMAQAVVDLGSEPRVIVVAQSMIAGQSAEIDAMQSMQAGLGCAG
ncbi:DUF305 domain-containing protein [Microbacter sp. GSS18]|nr:DUF305 domain-containing protein [Microbacter sp. GSS18]